MYVSSTQTKSGIPAYSYNIARSTTARVGSQLGTGSSPCLSQSSLPSPYQGALTLGKNAAASAKSGSVGFWNALEQFAASQETRTFLGVMGQFLSTGPEGAGIAARSALLETAQDAVLEYIEGSLGPLVAEKLAKEGLGGLDELLRSGGLPRKIAELSPYAARALGAVGAAYSVYDMVRSFGEASPQEQAMNGAATGAFIGSFFGPGPGTAIGGALGAAVGGISGLFRSSGKDRDQKSRDDFRDILRQAAVVDSHNNLTLADGTLYNIGFDGQHRLESLDGTQRRAYEVDFAHPLAPEVIGWVQPLVALFAQGNEKLQCDFTGYLTNAALSNAADLESARLNVLRIFEASGITPDRAAVMIDLLERSGRISPLHSLAFQHGLSTLFAATTALGQPTAELKRQP